MNKNKTDVTELDSPSRSDRMVIDGTSNVAEKIEEIKKVFSDYDKEIPIIIHDFPDPDAIASALGITAILKSLNLKPGSIYYSGEISHPQNKSLVTLLNISAINYEKEPFEKGLWCACVDTNDVGEGTNQRSVRKEDAVVKLVVDHHKGKHPKNCVLDNRYVGATSSIIWEYLKQISYDFASEEGTILATALLVGIKTDTQELISENTAQIDFKASQDLIQLADKQTLVSIINYPLPEYFFELRQVANLDQNKTFVSSTMIAGLGIISTTKRDALPVIADEFLRMSSVQTSVVFAIIENYLDIAVRSKNITIDVGEFLQTIFKTGGGKRGAGRAKISLGYFELNGHDSETKDKIWDVVKAITMNRVMTNIKGE